MTCPACQQPTAFVAGKCVKCGHVVPSLKRAAEASADHASPKTMPVQALARPTESAQPQLSAQGREYLEAALAFGKKEGIGVDGDTLPTALNVNTAGGWNKYVGQLKQWMPPVPSLGAPCGSTNARALGAMSWHLLFAVLLSPVFLLVVGGIGYVGAYIVTFIASLIVEPLKAIFGPTSGLVVAAIALGKKWVAVMGVVLIVPGCFWAWWTGEGVEQDGRRTGNESRGAAMFFAFGAGFLTVLGAALCVQAWLVFFKPHISLPADNKEAADAIVFTLGHLPQIGLVLGAVFGICCAVICAKSFATGRVCPHCHLQMTVGESVALPIGVTRLLILAARAGDATAMKGALRARPKMRSPDTPATGPGVAAGKVAGYHCPGCALGIMDVEVATHSWGISEFNHKPEAQNEVSWVAWSGELKDPEVQALLGGGAVEEFDADGADVLRQAAMACGASEVRVAAARKGTKAADGQTGTSSCWSLVFWLETGTEGKEDKANPPAVALIQLLNASPMSLTDAEGRALDRVGDLSNTLDLWASQSFLCPFDATLPLSLHLPWGKMEIKAKAANEVGADALSEAKTAATT